MLLGVPESSRGRMIEKKVLSFRYEYAPLAFHESKYGEKPEEEGYSGGDN